MTLLDVLTFWNQRVALVRPRLSRNQVQAVDAVHWVDNDTLGRVPMGTLCGQRPPATGDRLAHSPHVGEHTREILEGMGYKAGDIDGLAASGVVACYRG